MSNIEKMVDGFAFYQGHLDQLKKDLDSKNPMPASAYAVYVTLYSMINTDGKIAKDVTASTIIKKSLLQKTSVYDAVKILAQRGFITIENVDGKNNYQITGSHNLKISKQNKTSYFRIHNALITSGSLAHFVKMAKPGAIWASLNFCAHTSRNQTRRNSNKAEFKTDTLKEYIKTNLSKTVRKVLSVVNNFLEVNPMDRIHREVNSVLRPNYREQIIDYKFEVKLYDQQVVERDSNFIVKSYRSRLYSILQAMNVQLKQADYSGIDAQFYSQIGYVHDAMVNVGADAEQFVRQAFYRLQDALDFEHKQGNKLYSPGAFITKTIVAFVKDTFLKDTSTAVKVYDQLCVESAARNKELPSAWSEIVPFIMKQRKVEDANLTF